MKPKILSKGSPPVLIFLGLMIFGAAISFAQTPTLRRNCKIAFSSTRDGNAEIYVMNSNGRTDAAVYWDGAWYMVQSSTGSISYRQFGLSSDIPVATANAQ